MQEPASESPEGRAPLSRERVLRGAVAVADAAGIGALTIRSLAQELGVKPMSVYHYVANKDEILDGIVDLVFGEIDLPSTDVRASGAPAPPLGDRAHGVADHPRSRDAATPRRGDRHPAWGGLLDSDDRPRVRPARQLRVRIRAAGGVAALRGTGDRRRGCRTDDAAVSRGRVSPPGRDGDRAHPEARLRLRGRVRLRPRRDPRRPHEVDHVTTHHDLRGPAPMRGVPGARWREELTCPI